MALAGAITDGIRFIPVIWLLIYIDQQFIMSIQIKLGFLLHAALLCMPLCADELFLHQLGESVELDAREPAADIKARNPRPGSEQILGRVAIEPTRSSPPSFFVSGRVISDNTGGGLERVAIFIGQDKQAPELAAMTNADGDFKFRLWIKVDHRSPRVNIPRDFSGYLYVGGYPSLTHRNVSRLMSGYAIRYKLTDLAVRSELKLPVSAESEEDGKLHDDKE